MKLKQLIITLCVLVLSFHIIDAFALMDPIKAAAQATKEGLNAPTPESDGRIYTLNHKGAMAPHIDKISEEFIKTAVQDGKKVLEIGAGYGLVCIESLKRGAKDYTANDLDVRHLKILARNLQEVYPIGFYHLKLSSGNYLDGIDEKETEFDAILVARVFHFMTPTEASTALQMMHRQLKPGGKVYAVMLTPYVRGFSSFIPEFERRVSKGEPFPGYVENLEIFVDPKLSTKIKQTMDRQLMFFNAKVAKSFFEKNGFVVEKCEEMPLAYTSEFWELDGRENVGVIARKIL